MTGKPEDQTQEDIKTEEPAAEAAGEATTAEATAPEDGAVDETVEAKELTPEEQLAAAEAKAGENWDRYLRATAELENVRKRVDREAEKARKFALERFSKDLLEVVDTLEMGVKAAGEEGAEVTKLKEGSELTLKMLVDVLGRYGVKVIETEGASFNPEQHEALTMIPMPGAEPNSIIDVMQKGYTLNERVLRAAKVVVAKGE